MNNIPSAELSLLLPEINKAIEGLTQVKKDIMVVENSSITEEQIDQLYQIKKAKDLKTLKEALNHCIKEAFANYMRNDLLPEFAEIMEEYQLAKLCHKITVKKMKTWGGESEFKYRGSVSQGVILIFGSKDIIRFVDRLTLKQMLIHFYNQEVHPGASHDYEGRPENSLGKWLLYHGWKTGIVSYLAPFLVKEGYAEKVGTNIKFIKKPN